LTYIEYQGEYKCTYHTFQPFCVLEGLPQPVLAAEPWAGLVPQPLDPPVPHPALLPLGLAPPHPEVPPVLAGLDLPQPLAAGVVEGAPQPPPSPGACVLAHEPGKAVDGARLVCSPNPSAVDVISGDFTVKNALV
jgi:hypothetical protein